MVQIRDFALSPAYPNPFNPVTTLKFGLPANIHVSLEVYDINSRLLDELQSDTMEAGYHSIVWDAKSTGSGIYFVKMVAGDFVNTQKLMLVNIDVALSS